MQPCVVTLITAFFQFMLYTFALKELDCLLSAEDGTLKILIAHTIDMFGGALLMFLLLLLISASFAKFA